MTRAPRNYRKASYTVTPLYGTLFPQPAKGDLLTSHLFESETRPVCDVPYLSPRAISYQIRQQKEGRSWRTSLVMNPTPLVSCCASASVLLCREDVA
jgi:hypothetical protein